MPNRAPTPYRSGDPTKKWITKTVTREMKKVLEDDPYVRVVGPLTVSGMSPELRERIEIFRQEQYVQDTSYLISAYQREIDEKPYFDARSSHFLAFRVERLIGVVRVNPPPFELAAPTSELGRVAKRFEDFLELSRLVDKEERAHGIGRKLAYAAMLWANELQYRGFVAICRPHRAKEFERLGLLPYEEREFPVRSRGGHPYFLMAGDWGHLLVGTELHAAKKRVKARVQKLVARNKKPWIVKARSKSLLP